jgi:hypothetical protein
VKDIRAEPTEDVIFASPLCRMRPVTISSIDA